VYLEGNEHRKEFPFVSNQYGEADVTQLRLHHLLNGHWCYVLTARRNQ
jgi:hypothetical protein